jgi:curved DNA-binding protein CbpA
VTDPTPDPYKILQVDPEAEDEVIAAAYRRLARKYHPDTATGAESVGRMEAINAAWEVLGDPKRRAAHDRQRAVQAAMSRASAASAGSWPGAGGPTGPTGAAGTPGSTSESSGDGAARPGTRSGAAPGGARPASSSRPNEPETVSRDWTTGRSSVGGGYDPSMRTADGTGAAGRPPGNPSGSVMNFGRYAGWSLGEIARSDLEYLEWLDRMPIGRPYRDEIDVILRASGRRRSAAAETRDRRGLFRRR